MILCDVCALKLVDAKLTEPLFKIIPEGKNIGDAEYVADPSKDKCESCGKPATLKHPQANKEMFTKLADQKKADAEAKKANGDAKYCPVAQKDCVKDKCMAWRNNDCNFLAR